MREIRRLRLRPIFNKPYNPEGNPIESVFGTLKREFKKLKLKAIANNEEFDPVVLVRRAVNSLDREGVQNTCTKGLRMWRDTREWNHMMMQN